MILIGLLEDEPRLLRLGQAARKRFERSFDAAVVGPLLERLFASTQTGLPKAQQGREKDLV